MSHLTEQIRTTLGAPSLDPEPWLPDGAPPRVGILLDRRRLTAWYDDPSHLIALITAAQDGLELLLRARELHHRDAMSQVSPGPEQTPRPAIPPLTADPAAPTLYEALGGDDQTAGKHASLARPYIPVPTAGEPDPFPSARP
ncbi:hypothetical protein Aple_010420 [Acrocarpospora pleiomorpha]|uniref:Uncharacterized protein n=1 Tax=Acrocarpospora pleiomorpha TaxID=90975 RepID=A0A5M3X8V0_9ACTN|nr:hypothetical protein [Acrocarpospora pleiomorpha]GES18147.1 hypothetical protein Aple_010420 [Acrocarpospora pleiomorpha]